MTTSTADGKYKQKFCYSCKEIADQNYGYFNVEGDDGIMVGYYLHRLDYC